MGFSFNRKQNETVVTENEKSSTEAPNGQDAISREGGVLSEDQPVKKVEDESISSDAQAGVQKIEAAAQVWTKWHLTTAYTLYVEWICCLSLC